MHLNQILKPELLNDNLEAKTKTEALAELSDMITKSHPQLACARILDILQQRETLGSTGIGDGIAIPHGKIGELDELVAAFGRSKDGVAFDSADGKPVHIFFLLLAPEDCAGQHLKALARISKMSKIGNFRKKIMEAKNKAELYKIILEQDETCLV